MAGNFPDAPGPRMAYDRDGSVGARWLTNNVVTQLTAAQMKNINNESDDDIGDYGNYDGYDTVCLIFPELRDLQGYAAFYSKLSNFTVSVSPDTTSGVDGTWTTVSGGGVKSGVATSPNYRSMIQPLASTGIKGIRIYGQHATSYQNLRAFHVYGKPSTPLAVAQRLLLWHPTLDQPLFNTPAALDFGNRPRSSVATKQFRVKNMSDVLSANGIAVTTEALTDAVPSVVATHTLSAPSITAAPSISIGTLAPGAISPVVTLTQSLGDSAALSVWSQRVTAVPASWS